MGHRCTNAAAEMHWVVFFIRKTASTAFLSQMTQMPGNVHFILTMARDISFPMKMQPDNTFGATAIVLEN